METFVFHLMPYKEATDDAWPFPNDTYDPELGSTYYNEYLDFLELAEEYGYDGIGVNEHHFSAYGMQPSPVVTAANLAARTDDIRIGFFGNVVATRANPVRLAEEIAMLDNISEGRIVSGFPRGIPTEYAALGVDIEESRSRFEEAWDLVLKTWTADEPFDWDGEHFQYENVYAWPRPYQDPHPPLWMPAESDESLRFAAKNRVPIGSTFNPPENMREFFDTYREFATDEFGWSPGDEEFTISRKVYVAETTEQAKAEVRDHLEFFYKTLTTGIHLGATAFMMGETYDPDEHEKYVENLHPHGELAYNFDFEEFVEMGEVIVGDPETVVAEIERQYEIVDGFGRLAGQFQYGDMPIEKAEKNLKLYAEEVMPAIRQL
ncbi:LLM class flavin-dependent oxidoreductase [Natrarchaeobius sp. A-rgal3]|uniref:LLM class flavin-dependent oxidoreductase n=1 Tax=Natrarchaeobius versutus TaxID=1679078 RepID=UPI003510937E